MEKEKLLIEYKTTLDSFVEKNKFVYSEEFYKLDDFDKQKYHKDKMATEAHLSTLCELLWGKKIQFGNNGLFDLFGLGIIGSMFSGGGFGSSNASFDYLKKTPDEDDKKNTEQTVVIPEK